MGDAEQRCVPGSVFKGSLLNTDGKRAGVTAGGRCGTLQYSGWGARAAWTREEGDGV